MVVVALVVLGLLGTALVSRSDPAVTMGEALTQPTRVIVADFTNHTADSLLGALVTEALRIDLGQSHAIRVVDRSLVDAALRRMGRRAGAGLSPDVAREVAAREGGAGVVAGDVYRAGPTYVLAARLMVSNGDSAVVALRETAPDSTHLVAAIDRLSGSLRQSIGESLVTVRAGPLLERMTTGSLPALRLFTEAVHAGWLEGSDQDLSIRLLEQALTLDPAFAMAHRVLALALAERGLDAYRSGELRARAFELRHRLPELERYLAEGSYWIWVGDRDAQMAAWNRVLELRPNDFRALDYLGLVHLSWGDFDRAEELFRRSYDDRPTGTALEHLVQVQLAKGEIDAAREVLARFKGEYPDHPGLLANAVSIDYATDDYASAVARWRSLEETSPGWVAGGAVETAGILALLGKLREADQEFEGGLMIYEDERRSWNHMANVAWRAAVAGHVEADTTAGLERLDRLLDQYAADSLDVLTRALSGLSMVQVALVEVAAAYAFLGRPARASELVVRMEEALPPSRRRWAEGDRLAVLGAIALARGDLHEANRRLRQAMMERSWPPTVFVLQGRIRERQGAPRAAAGAYERFLATPVPPDAHRRCCHVFGQVGSDALWRPWIHRRLGELYEKAGERTRALAHYRAFVDLRQDADPGLQPEVSQVRDRIERLTPAARGAGAAPP